MSDADEESEASVGFFEDLANDLSANKDVGSSAPANNADASSKDSSCDVEDPLSALKFSDAVPNSFGFAKNGVITGYVGNAFDEVSREWSRYDIQWPGSADGDAWQQEKDEILETEGVDVDDLFAKLQAARTLHDKRPSSDAAISETCPKRRRADECVQPPSQSVEAPSLGSQEVSGKVVVHASPTSFADMPERVVFAFNALDLPLNATLREVHKRSRRLAFRCHPDKVNPKRRWQAAQEFRKIQDAKAVVLGWILKDATRDAGEDSDGSVVPSGEESSGIDGDAGGNDSGSLSDEAAEELQVCGIKRKLRGEYASSPSGEEGSDEEKANGPEGFALEVVREPVVEGTDPLKQILALKGGVGQTDEQRACAECLVKRPADGSEICADCAKEWRGLEKILNGRLR